MPANNPWIAVEDIVPEICDGKYTLKITNGTYVLLNEGSNMPQTILFEYRGDDDITANDFEATWTKNINFGSSDAPTISYSNGKGYVHYTLGSIENELKEGVIHLLDKKHNLSRNIHLYSITQFDYEFRFPTTMGKESTSTSTLSLKIPANYPKELLPGSKQYLRSRWRSRMEQLVCEEIRIGGRDWDYPRNRRQERPYQQLWYDRKILCESQLLQWWL